MTILMQIIAASANRARAFVLGMIMLSGPLAAQSQDWQLRTTLYAWGAGLDGNARVAPLPPVTVEQDFGDVLSSLDFAAMGIFEARRGRWGVWADLQHVRLSESGRVPALALPARVRVRTEGMLLAATYRLLEQDAGYLDVLAGARLWSLDTRLQIDLPAPSLPPGLPSRVERTGTIAAPQFGIKGSYSFSERFFVTGWAMAGAAGDTDLSSDLMLGLGYQFNPLTGLVLGYRRVDIDYAGNRLQFDASFEGPGIGLDLRF